MIVKPISLIYKEGFYQSSNRNKKRSLEFDKAEHISSNGNGFYKLTSYSKYYLTFKIGEFIHTIDIRYDFSTLGIRLIKRRRDIIEASLPQVIEVDYDEKLKSYRINLDRFAKWISSLDLEKEREINTNTAI